MNKLMIESEWNEAKGRIKSKWGQLTDDDLMRIDGDRDRLVAALQKRYGLAKDEAHKELENWLNAA